MAGVSCNLLSTFGFLILIALTNGFSAPSIGRAFQPLLVLGSFDNVARQETRLYNKKKKAAPAATKKIQVKMLKYVEGTGHVGEVVMVTPAYFNNKLRPTSSAVVISDEEIELEKSTAEALEKELNQQAEAVKEKLNDFTLTIRRKAGPNGHLFGAISQKNILSELNEKVKDDFLHSKGVRVTEVVDADGKKMQTDIKNVGEYEATLSLTKNKTIKLKVVVEVDH